VCNRCGTPKLNRKIFRYPSSHDDLADGETIKHGLEYATIGQTKNLEVEEGVVHAERAEAEDAALPSERFEERDHPPQEVARLFPFGVDRARIEQVVRHARLPVAVVRDLKDADMLLTTRTQYKRHPTAVKDAEEAGRPVYVLRKNSLPQIEQFLRALSRSNGGRASSNEAMEEAEEAVDRLLESD
ncbi:MAG: hypothetical protein IH921_12815, partial [Gemmatimonadetes bacterium]|nr:hypothetical protein [Gemmatimonadota bacterium]